MPHFPQNKGYIVVEAGATYNDEIYRIGDSSDDPTRIVRTVFTHIEEARDAAREQLRKNIGNMPVGSFSYGYGEYEDAAMDFLSRHGIDWQNRSTNYDQVFAKADQDMEDILKYAPDGLIDIIEMDIPGLQLTPEELEAAREGTLTIHEELAR